MPPSSTAKPDPPTVTVRVTVAPTQEYTERKQQNGTALLSGSAFFNIPSETELTTPTITAATLLSPVETYDLRSFSTDMSTMTLTRGGPAPALTVTDSAQNDSLSNTTSAPNATGSADETSSGTQGFNGNTLTWYNTFSNTTSGSGGCAASGTGAMILTTGSGISGYGASMTVSPTTPVTDVTDTVIGPENTGDTVGMTTLTSTASVASATSTVTLTNTALVIPVQANNTHPINVPDPSTSSHGDNTATEAMTSLLTAPSDGAIGIQITMPTESVQPAVTAVTAYDSIHIPHGHPPLMTGGQGHKNWNTSGSCTDFNTQEVSPTVPTPSSSNTTTTSRVFTGYPPSISGYNDGTNANTTASLHEPSTTAELVTPSAATHIEIPPPPTVPLNSCRPEIWGRPSCLSTHASFSEVPPSPLVHQVGDSTALSASSTVPVKIGTQTLSTSTNLNTQPAQAQCTSTFYSLPTNPCTSTVYASKQTVTINCFGCVGHHALPSIAANDGSVSALHHTLPVQTQAILTTHSKPCQSSTTITEPCTTHTMCGFPDSTTASSSFMTSVTGLSSAGAGASQSGNYTSTA